jgi:methylglutaconyl-CoA hydratase
VQQLCDSSAIDSVVDELIDQLLLGAPAAVANAKRLLRNLAPAALSAGEHREMQAAFEAMAKSDEPAEGRAAFQEKRKPRWYPPR